MAVVCVSLSNRFLTFQSKSAAATTFMVTNAQDSGPGSLGQAIIDANANAGADVINLSIGSFQRLRWL